MKTFDVSARPFKTVEYARVAEPSFMQPHPLAAEDLPPTSVQLWPNLQQAVAYAEARGYEVIEEWYPEEQTTVLARYLDTDEFSYDRHMDLHFDDGTTIGPNEDDTNEVIVHNGEVYEPDSWLNGFDLILA